MSDEKDNKKEESILGEGAQAAEKAEEQPKAEDKSSDKGSNAGRKSNAEKVKAAKDAAAPVGKKIKYSDKVIVKAKKDVPKYGLKEGKEYHNIHRTTADSLVERGFVEIISSQKEHQMKKRAEWEEKNG